MILHPTRQPRRAFTLLEVLLSMAIAIMLLGALYLALNMTLEQTQASRDSSDIEDLNRGVINQLTVDLSTALGPLPPKAGTTGSGGSGGSGMTGGASGDGDADDMSGGTGGSSMTDPSQTGAALLPFQGGIFGTNDGENATLVIFASRVPSALSTPGALNGGSAVQSDSDLRRIIYWKGSSGLCREERRLVTADGIGTSLEPDRSNEAASTIAEEVTGFNVEYADGSGGWATEWNSDPSSAASTGPPRAVRVTLTLQFPSSRRGGEPITKTLVHVIPIRTAPGSATVTLVDPVVATGTPSTGDGSADDGSGSGGSGSGGSGGGGGGGSGGKGGGAGGGGGKGGGGGSGGGKGGGGMGGGRGGGGGGGMGGGGMGGGRGGGMGGGGGGPGGGGPGGGGGGGGRGGR